MTGPADVLDIHAENTVDAALRERLDSVAETVHPDPDGVEGASRFATLVARRDACSRVRDLAADHPGAVRRVVPSLVAALRADHERATATVDDLFAGDVARQLRRHAVATLAAVSGPPLVAAYETADRSLDPFVAAVARAVTAADSGPERAAGTVALGWAALARPAEIADAVAGVDATDAVATAAAAAIESATPEETETDAATDSGFDGDDHRAVTWLVLALHVHAPQSPSLAVVCRTLRAVTERLDAVDRLAAALVSGFTGDSAVVLDRLADTLGVTPDPVSVADAVIDRGGSDRDRTARALGEALAVVGPDVAGDVDGVPIESVHRRLIERVRTATDGDRDRAARALGEATAATRSPAGLDGLATRLRVTSGTTYVRAAQALGDVLLAADECESGAFDTAVSDRLLARGRSATGATGDHLAQVIGEAAAVTRLTDDELTDALTDRLRRVTGDAAWDRASRALLIAANDDDSVSQTLLDRLPSPSAGDEADSPAGIVLAVAGASDAESPLAAVVSRTSEASGIDRDRLARALGVLAALGARGAASTGYRAELADAIRTIDGPAGDRAARALGEAFVAARSADGSVVEALAGCVQSESGADRDRAARALGETVVARGKDGEGAVGRTGSVDEVVPDPVLERAATATGRTRRRLTRAVGELVAATQGDGTAATLADDIVAALDPPTDGATPVATLVDRLDATDRLDRDRLVRALGETVRTEGVPAGATLVPEWLLAHADTLEGQRLTWAVRAIGTAVVATAAGEGVVEAAVERVATAEGMSRVRAARALGEVALAAPVPDDDFPAAGALLDRIAVEADASRIAAAVAAGDVVAAGRGHEAPVPKPLVDRIHNGTTVERDLAARALGDRVATTTELAPDGDRLAADLVARARSPATGTEPRSRWLAVQALGLTVASIAGRTGDAAVGFDRAQLARQVGDPTDEGDLLAARALGEALVVTDASPTLAPSAWTDRVRAGRDETSKAAAWGLGVAAAAEGPGGVATPLVEATVNPPARLQAAAVGRLVDEIAHTGTFPPDVLVSALTAGVRTHLDRNRSEADESAYGHLLEAVASAVAEDTTHRRPGLRQALHDVLAGPKEAVPSPSPQTRLTAVDALARLDSLAIENPFGSRGDDDDRG